MERGKGGDGEAGRSDRQDQRRGEGSEVREGGVERKWKRVRERGGDG